MNYTNNKSAAYRIAAAALAFCCSILLCFNPIKVNAIATETIIGGVLLAYMAACGISMLAEHIDASQAISQVYNNFASWYQTTDAAIDIGLMAAEVSIYKGYCKVSNALSNIFSDYVSQIDDNNISYSDSGRFLNGTKLVLRPDIKNVYNSVLHPGDPGYLALDTAYQYTDEGGYTQTLVMKAKTTGGAGAQLYKNGQVIWTGADQYDNNVIGNTGWCITKILGDGIYVFCWYEYQGQIRTTYNRSAIDIKFGTVEQKFTVEGLPESIPSETLELDNDTYLFPLENVTTIDGYVEKSGQLAAENELSLDYVNTNTSGIDEIIENAPPELDDYDVSDLRAILVTRFPFSIPWDIAAGLNALNAEPIAPSWTFQPLSGVTILPDEVQAVEISLDLSDEMWEPLFIVLRWGLLACYCAALVAATKNLIWG